jgi:predicted Zn-dependent protease
VADADNDWENADMMRYVAWQGKAGQGTARMLRAAAVVACTMLAGCASSTHSDRAALAAPTAVSEVYSQANLQVMLATTATAPECVDAECEQRARFDVRVAQVGAELAIATYQAHPELSERVPALSFSVVDKTEPGTGSTASGHIVVLRPVSGIARSDDALSFVLAREVGHVVAQHHEQNTGTSLIISLLATVVAPVVNVAKLLAVVYSGTASAAAASASMTAASFAGSKAIIESYRPRQREEADAIALKLVGKFGFDARSVTAGFAEEELRTPQTRWMRDLSASVNKLADVAVGESEAAEKVLAAVR